WESVFDIPEKENRIKELDSLSARDDLWSDPDKARDILKKKTKLDAIVDRWKKLKVSADDLEILLGLAKDENDEAALAEVDHDLESLLAAVRDEELRMMLGSEQDP